MTLADEWVPVAEFPAYEVNPAGQVRNRRTGRILKWQRHSRGYLQVSLHRRTRLVHRLVALAFLGPPPDGWEVDHINTDRADPRLENLRWLPHPENTARYHAEAESCGQGHPWTEENTYRRPRGPKAGTRMCRACQRDRHKRRYQ